MMLGQDAKRRVQHDQSVRTLKGVEDPFSFYQRDKVALENRKHNRTRDPNRFQRKFIAKEVPRHVKEVRTLRYIVSLSGYCKPLLNLIMLHRNATSFSGQIQKHGSFKLGKGLKQC